MIDLNRDMQWAFIDPPFYDPDFPADHISFKFASEGEAVYGHMWVAQGADRKGAVIISPQTWGGDCIETIIFPLLRCGINVVSFVPRGMWDRMQPAYTIYSAMDDLHALIEYVRSSGYEPETPLGKCRSRFDPDRIALFGISGGGGNVSFAACAESEYVHHAIAVAPANVDVQIHPDNFSVIRDSYEMVGRPRCADAMIEMYPDKVGRLSIIKQAERLAPKHLLLIGASHDSICPLDLCHKPMLNALRAAGAAHLTDLIFEADHMFMTKRNALATVLISWLRHEASF